MKPVVLMTDSHTTYYSQVQVIQLPFVGIEPLDVNVCIARHYDWLIFTSKNAVTLFFDSYPHVTFNRIASIGKKTTEQIAQYGYKVDFEPTIFDQEHFILEANGRFNGQTICLPCSVKARPWLHDYLQSVSDVFRIDLYQPCVNVNEVASAHNLIEMNKVDYITFMSPSAVHAYFERYSSTNIPVVAIGHVTGAVLDAYGQEYFLSEQSTKDSIINKIIESRINHDI